MNTSLNLGYSDVEACLNDFNGIKIKASEMIAFVSSVFTVKTFHSVDELQESVQYFFPAWNIRKIFSFVARVYSIYRMATENMLPGWAEMKSDGTLSVSSFIYLAACTTPMIEDNEDIIFDKDQLIRKAILIRLNFKRNKDES